ncbi:MAG: BamA/TamA family outer membrane protein [Paracoccaceae bacterium]
MTMPANHTRALFVAATLSLSLIAMNGRADQVQFTVAGTDKNLNVDLRAASVLLTTNKSKNITALDLFADARAEYGRLIGALYARGYYGPVIHVLVDGKEAANIAPLNSPARINQIVVTVDPGPVFAFSRAQVAPLAPKTNMPLEFAPGKVAESGVIKQAVQNGIDGWRARGYAKAHVSAQDLKADHNTNTLGAMVQIAPGPQLRFGQLAINGAVRMREKTVRRVAGLPTGKVFDPMEEARVAERLRRTGVFSSVTLTEDDKVTPPNFLGITADLVENKTRRYTFGAEIASTEGILLSGSWLHRNLLGGGERLEVTGSIANIGAQDSGVDYKLGVTLDRPATPGPDTTLNLGVSVEHRDDTDFQADIFTSTVGFTHYFSEQLTATAAIGYDFANGSDDAGSFTYRDVTLPIGVTWDRRDSKTDATRNFYIDAEAKPFYGFGQTDSGIRLAFDARAYKSIGANKGVVLAARFQGGAVLGASILGTPREDLFYSGGGGTVRGQPYQSLGATVDDNGTPINIGGNTFLGASFEARVKVSEKISVVGFTDFGLIGVDGISSSNSDWQAGAGVGVRYATGVGPVRLDIGVPIHGNPGGGVQIYVGLGQAF